MNTKVLIVDDELMVRYALKKILQNLGLDVVEATDGREGEEVFDSHPDVGVVITDIIMPRQEGIETIANMRRKRPSTKIIAISGGGRIRSLDFLEIAKKAGADAILAKPFTRADLQETLRSCGAL